MQKPLAAPPTQQQKLHVNRNSSKMQEVQITDEQMEMMKVQLMNNSGHNLNEK
jgi:hypothetical protein